MARKNRTPRGDGAVHEGGLFVPDEPAPTKEPVVSKRNQGSKVIPLEERRFTLDQYVRQKGDLGRAFAVSESLSTGGKVTKRTRSEWEALYETWMKAPRG